MVASFRAIYATQIYPILLVVYAAASFYGGWYLKTNADEFAVADDDWALSKEFLNEMPWAVPVAVAVLVPVMMLAALFMWDVSVRLLHHATADFSLLLCGGKKCRALWEERTLLSERVRKTYDAAEHARTVSWARSHVDGASGPANEEKEAERQAAKGAELVARKMSIGAF